MPLSIERYSVDIISTSFKTHNYCILLADTTTGHIEYCLLDMLRPHHHYCDKGLF